MKECKECHEIKPLSEFHKSKNHKDGHRSICKVCRQEEKRIYRENNKDKIKESSKLYSKNNKEKINEYRNAYKTKNKDKIKEKDKIYREKNKDKIKEKNRKYNKNKVYVKKIIQKKEKTEEELKQSLENNKLKKKQRSKLYREKNKDIIRDKKKLYRENNKETIRIKKRNDERKRRETDPYFRMMKNLKTLVRSSFKNYSRFGKTKACKQYGIDFSKIFEKLGPYPENCHIDHIIPMVLFNLDILEHVRLCYSPENLRYISIKDNCSKSDKIIWELIESDEKLLEIASILKLTKEYDGMDGKVVRFILYSE